MHDVCFLTFQGRGILQDTVDLVQGSLNLEVCIIGFFCQCKANKSMHLWLKMWHNLVPGYIWGHRLYHDPHRNRRPSDVQINCCQSDERGLVICLLFFLLMPLIELMFFVLLSRSTRDIGFWRLIWTAFSSACFYWRKRNMRPSKFKWMVMEPFRRFACAFFHL
jgi:hypothetical protein